MCRRGCVVLEDIFSKVELRLANSAELLGLKFTGIRGGKSRLGGNGGGDVPSRGGRIGAFGACLA